MTAEAEDPAKAYRLDGKAAVITGAGRGLGRAYADLLARLGCSVVVNDVDAASARAAAGAIRAAGGTAVDHPGSVAESSFAASLIDRCVEHFGAIDVLVNNAGVLVQGPAWTIDESAIRRIVDVNILGTWFCGTRALERMVAAGSGLIVNATSGALLGVPGLSAYGATKGAIASMTTAWAADAAGTGVRVIGIMPVADTPMMATQDTRPSWSKQEQSPERVAPLIAYLASDQGAGVSGVIIRDDGVQLSVVEPMTWPASEVLPVPHGPDDIGQALGKLLPPKA